MGRFVSPQQDGLFLYDRTAGQGRLMDFTPALYVKDYQALGNMSGNWQVYSGDFTNAGRSQMLLYDPSAGNAQMLSFDQKLALSGQKSYTHLGTNQVLYVGHFGSSNLSAMLYDQPHALSTFFSFDKNQGIAQQYLVKTWDQHHQILVGDFVDRSRCAKNSDCTKNDDILVLNRQNGQMAQYSFSFGRKFHVYDNRAQALVRLGVPIDQHMTMVDTTSFGLLSTLQTGIKDEELY